MKSIYWILIFITAYVFYYNSTEIDSRYTRPINGDAKGYYAYLPALFIYHDSNYKFIDTIEKKYYPEDFSQAKDFKNKQANGQYVNKCFPGLSILYLPFFVLATIVAWFGNFALDGYSLPYQLSISFSHFFYLFCGILLLQKFLFRLQLSKFSIQASLFSFLIGTNCWYYLIYDHTVSHIFNFFITTVFLFFLQKWISTKATKWVGLTLIILSFQLIIRPTGLMNVLFIPFIFHISNLRINKDIIQSMHIKTLSISIFFSILILSIPPFLWKWQSDLWLVYSYNNETFDFSNPQWFNFMFSIQKGWLFWNPLILITIGLISYYFIKIDKLIFIKFIFPLFIITYVFSSWWCWTFGMGFGSRVMIDFYPYLIIGLALFLNHFKHKILIIFLFIPFIILNLIQNYQVTNSILIGGSTTSKDYSSHFLQLKTDAPKVKTSYTWQLVQSKEKLTNEIVCSNKPFSSAISSDSLTNISKIVIKAKIGGKHKDQNLRIILSNSSGSFYKTIFLYKDIYQKTRQIEYLFKLPSSDLKDVYTTYLWNGNTDSEAKIDFIKMELYN